MLPTSHRAVCAGALQFMTKYKCHQFGQKLPGQQMVNPQIVTTPGTTTTVPRTTSGPPQTTTTSTTYVYSARIWAYQNIVGRQKLIFIHSTTTTTTPTTTTTTETPFVKTTTNYVPPECSQGCQNQRLGVGGKWSAAQFFTLSLSCSAVLPVR